MAAYARLLGSPAVRTRDGWTPLTAGKAAGILCYLAYRQAWVPRDDLLSLFWSESSEQAARANLRVLLTRTRRLPYVERLETDGDLLRWPVKTDVQAFHQALADGQPARALAAYGGPLMDGLDVAQAPGFESWVTIARDELETTWRAAALRTTEALVRDGGLDEASEILASLLRTDPLDEDATRRAMRVKCIVGDRRTALQIYEAFEALLHEELALAPEDATRLLADRIRAGECGPATTTPTTRPPTAGAPQRVVRTPVPRHTTAFIGRHADVERASGLLRDPFCRLLTLVGPGGIGKTRLALHLADALGGAFDDNVFYLAGDTVDLPEDLPAAIAASIGCSLFGAADARARLIDAIGDDQVLLVLDNLEHLVPGAGMLEALLESCPRLTLLATSRQRLGTRGEWVFDVRGLECPSPPPTHAGAPLDADIVRDVEACDAVALFVQAATRARGNADLSDEHLGAIIAVCQALDGLPLGIELAASVTRLLRPDEIAERLSSLPELLERADSDISPDRNRLRAMFERSWDLLTAGERKALAALTVFRGGFTLEAASSALGVDVPNLLALVDKSILRRDHTGRFTFHPLLHHFVSSHTRDDEVARRTAANRHAAHFIAFAARHDGSPRAGMGRARLGPLRQEIENVQAAWLHAADMRRHDWLLDAMSALGWFCFATGDHERGLRMMRHAMERVPEDSVLHARLATISGLLLDHVGRLQESIALLERSAEVLERFGVRSHLAFTLQMLGTRYHRHSGAHIERAVACFQRALEIYRSRGDAEGTTMMQNNLAYHAPTMLDSIGMLEACIAGARRDGALHALSHALDTYAEALSYGQGEHAGALDAMLESLDVTAETDDFYTRMWIRLRCAHIMVRGGFIDDASTMVTAVEADATPFDRHTRHALIAAAATVRAHVDLTRGDPERALTACERAYEGGATALPRYALAHLLAAAVRASLLTGRPADARHWHDMLTTAIDGQPTSGSFELREAVIVAAALRAAVHLQQGDVDACGRELDAVLHSARTRGYLPAALECLLVRVAAAHRVGREARATRLATAVGTHSASTSWNRTVATSMLRQLAGAHRA